ncbi:MAG: hypothetical protein HFG50_13950 [Lachnospiraceae bacterium]|jgi:hypothetical protein|nr:hypothetical protein [Lachnospiraceae bacterium]
MRKKEKSNVNLEKGKPFDKIWKKWWFWVIIVSFVIGGMLKETESETKESTVALTETTEQAMTESATIEESETDEQTEIEESIREEEITSTQTEESVKETVEHREGMYGISDKNIKDVDAHFSVSNAFNDVTGRWRVSAIAEPILIEEYALSYYENYFSDDNEVHVIVNFTYNTSTTITCLGSILDVTIHEYVDKEEHDAKKMSSGMVLSEYYIYLDNGDIEQIQ